MLQGNVLKPVNCGSKDYKLERKQRIEEKREHCGRTQANNKKSQTPSSVSRKRSESSRMSRNFDTGGAPHFPPHQPCAGDAAGSLALVPASRPIPGFSAPASWCRLLATFFALAFEALMLKLRGQPMRLFLGDFSAILTAVLFALCIPPLAPWWIALTGMLFAIVVAKHLYGGLGHNTFNPAMVGYVVVLISFPQAMTAWPQPATRQSRLGAS